MAKKDDDNRGPATAPGKSTLDDGDIRTARGMSRRRVLRGFGLGTLGLGGAAALSGCVPAGGITDADAGIYADPVGMGRGAAGITDSDSGRYADPAGRGRGRSGITDSDLGAFADPVGRGRGRTGLTDSDSGPYADPVGRGRRGY